MSPPPSTKANRPAALDAAMPSALASCCGVQAAQLAGRHGGAERADRAGRMKAALAQVGRAGAGERDVGLVAGDDRLDQRARRSPRAVVADREHRRHHHAAAMRRAVAIAVVELDAMRRRAAEEGGVEQVGAPGAARHRDVPGRPHRGDDGLGLGRDVPSRARDHHADGVEQMPPRVVPRLLGQRVVAQRCRRTDDRVGCAGGGLNV